MSTVEQVKAWQYKYNHSEARRISKRKYITTHRDQIRDAQRKHRQTPEYKISRSIQRKLYNLRPEVQKRNKARMQKIGATVRTTVLHHYGDKCACCGQSEPKFLGVDHVNGGGRKARKEQGAGGMLYRWLIKNKFPNGFQLLCHNCNLAKGFYGVCPHKVTSH